jgi:predicted permease
MSLESDQVSPSTRANTFEGMARDLRYAFRTLRREPAFAAGVVLTFALAIGTNAAMFGLVARLMLAAPPGIHGADRVAQVRLNVKADDGTSIGLSTTSYPMFRALRTTTSAFVAVAGAKPDTLTIGRAPDVGQIAVLSTTGDYFTALGARALIGRVIGVADDEPPAGSQVIVLGYAYWQRMFAGDRSVLGKELIVDDRRFTVIGVAERGFNGDGLSAVDAFIPFSAAMGKGSSEWMSNRFMNLISLVARVRDGVAFSAAQQMATAAIREDASMAGRARTPVVELTSMIPTIGSRQSSQSEIALWLAGVSLIVLLIATANVGTLLALRSARRRREIAVRIAMGARHADLARQLLIESVLLAAIGGGTGLLFSNWFSGVIRATLLPNLAPVDVLVDRRVLLATAVAAMLAGLLAGLAPVSQAGQTNLSAQLRSGGGSGTSGRLAFQNMLIGVQVALCTLLVVGASLFVRSLQRVKSQDLGFSTAELLYVTIDFRGYVPGLERDLTYQESVRRVRGLTGVKNATAVMGIPFGPHNIPPVSVPGSSQQFGPGGGVQPPIMYAATSAYLQMMDASLVAGRLLNDNDRRGTPQVVIVNESMAKTIWPQQSALGKCVRVGFGPGFSPGETEGNPADGAPCREVVGVVRDSRARSLRPERNEDKIMQYYVPLDQAPDPPMPDLPRIMGLMVQSSGDLDRTASLVQRTIHAGSARPVYARARRYQDLIDPQLRSWRLGATLFSAFSVLALGIAAVGLFAVVSYVVTQRTQEIGVRLALGGTGRRVVGLIVSDAIRMASVGIGAGIGAALLAGPLVASMLFQTSPREPASVAAAAGVLLVTTLAAAIWPAWRAGRVNPVLALRSEG